MTMQMPELVAVGGAVTLKRSVTFFMHKGYDIPPTGLIGDLGEKYVNKEPAKYLVGGDPGNPLSSWPIYAIVEIKP